MPEYGVPPLNREPALPATYRPERWVRVPDQSSIDRVKEDLYQGRQSSMEDIADLVLRNTTLAKTLVAVVLQAAELREALALVDPEAAALLHDKHKKESQS